MFVHKMFLVVVSIVTGAAVFAGWWFFAPHVPEGVSRRTGKFGEREVTFLVVQIPDDARVRLLADADNPKSVLAWRESTGASLVVNGSYFLEDNQSSGYWEAGGMESQINWPTVEEQKDPVGYTFAVSTVEEKLALRYLPNEPMDEPADDTFLSFPTLMANGEPMVSRDSGLLARRTVLASQENGHDYLIVTERGELSLYELSRWLAEQPERFTIAGNLDGGPSTGLSLENGWHDMDVRSAGVPNVVAIFVK